MIPHEFGHLVGLEDEYERSHGDFVRVTGGPATGDPAQATAAAALARSMHDAMFLDEALFEWHTTAVQRRMAALNRVMTRNGIGGYNWGSTPLTRQTAIEYRRIYGRELTADLAAQCDRDGTSGSTFRSWRESVAGAFQFVSSSIMGDMTDHSHPVAARHVAPFVRHVQALMGGTWTPVQDH